MAKVPIKKFITITRDNLPQSYGDYNFAQNSKNGNSINITHPNLAKPIEVASIKILSEIDILIYGCYHGNNYRKQYYSIMNADANPVLTAGDEIGCYGCVTTDYYFDDNGDKYLDVENNSGYHCLVNISQMTDLYNCFDSIHKVWARYSSLIDVYSGMVLVKSGIFTFFSPINNFGIPASPKYDTIQQIDNSKHWSFEVTETTDGVTSTDNRQILPFTLGKQYWFNVVEVQGSIQKTLVVEHEDITCKVSVHSQINDYQFLPGDEVPCTIIGNFNELKLQMDEKCVELFNKIHQTTVPEETLVGVSSVSEDLDTPVGTESDVVEFRKSILFPRSSNDANAKEQIFDIAKSITSAANTNGCKIFIGINDNGTVCGIADDLPYLSASNIDGAEEYTGTVNSYIQLLKDELGRHIENLNEHTTFKAIDHRGKIVIDITVKASQTPVFIDNRYLFVRNEDNGALWHEVYGIALTGFIINRPKIIDKGIANITLPGSEVDTILETPVEQITAASKDTPTAQEPIPSEDINVGNRLETATAEERKHVLYDVYNQTRQIVNREYFIDEKLNRVDLNLSPTLPQDTIFYDDINRPAEYTGDKPFSTVFEVPGVDDDESTDSLVAIFNCEDENPCLLCMADSRYPGGSAELGASKQEAYLFRCTDYYRSLMQFTPDAAKYGLEQSEHKYPLHSHYGAVYSPNVTMFRDTETGLYDFLVKDDISKFNVIALGPCNQPATRTTRNGIRICNQDTLDRIHIKMQTLFRIALANGHTTLILGAWGCGAAKNPPRHIAELFLEVLTSPEFDGAFKRIVFPIIDDDTRDIFYDVFIRQGRNHNETVLMDIENHIIPTPRDKQEALEKSRLGTDKPYFIKVQNEAAMITGINEHIDTLKYFASIYETSRSIIASDDLINHLTAKYNNTEEDLILNYIKTQMRPNATLDQIRSALQIIIGQENAGNITYENILITYIIYLSERNRSRKQRKV